MTRKFMKGDVVSCGGDQAIVNLVENTFLKTDKGWILIEKTTLIRPANKLYKEQFKAFDERLIAKDRPIEIADEVADTVLDALSRMMEK